MEELERTTMRLDNVLAVRPILNALRTIALGSRLLATSRTRTVSEYERQLLRALAQLSTQLPARHASEREEPPTSNTITILVIGSERGLCGAFNSTVVARARKSLEDHTEGGRRVVVTALGKQVERAFRREGLAPLSAGRLSATALPRYVLARELTTRWLDDWESGQCDAVEVVYNAYGGLAAYQPTVAHMLPPALPAGQQVRAEWPPIAETDPLWLYVKAVELWLSARLYAVMLESAAAEHAARYQLLEGASQNAQELITELQTYLQVARQESITAEMQDLAAGAGLLG